MMYKKRVGTLNAHSYGGPPFLSVVLLGAGLDGRGRGKGHVWEVDAPEGEERRSRSWNQTTRI